ncbi:MAG: hypothetical protein K1W24_09960 [Lachnospiraceae bacterium]
MSGQAASARLQAKQIVNIHWTGLVKEFVPAAKDLRTYAYGGNGGLL